MKILPGIYLVAGPGKCSRTIQDYRGCCVYLIRGEKGGHVLIDTGFGFHTAPIVQLLESLNVKPSDIGLVVCTHSHNDHTGGAAFFQSKGAEIALHHMAGEWIDSIPPVGNGKYPNDKPFLPSDHAHEPFRPDIRFSDGDMLRTASIELRVLHTPGHTPDSSCLVLNRNGKRVLFSGDLTGYFIIGWGSDQVEMLESVKKARALNTDYICSGHCLIGEDIPGYWDKLEKSVADGIFSLVDRYHANSHAERTAEKLFAELKDT